MTVPNIPDKVKTPSVSAKKTSLLIVEDNVALAENLYEFLGNEDYIIDYAHDGHTALNLVDANSYDVIVLDVMLPGIDGFEVCSRIRNELGCDTPIIFMTARDTLSDKEQGFLRGGDDYLVKPFELRELQLRIDAMCRRRTRRKLIRAGMVSYDPGTLQVSLDNGESAELIGIGAKLFESLIRAYPSYVSYNSMIELIWGDLERDPGIIHTHMHTLRKCLQQQFGRQLIKTVHGLGYRLHPPNEDRNNTTG
jgi:DNA-binding response OmpR family regulator